MTSLRIMKSGDVPAGLALCRAAGWNQLSGDWEMFIKANPDGCFVAGEDRVEGTVTTMRYQDHFSWIGMLLVDPVMRRRGIGMDLLTKSLEYLQHEETVKLDATPAGRELYLKMNFTDEYKLSRMVLEKPTVNFEFTGARIITCNDLQEITSTDLPVFGADRCFLLKWMWECAPQLAFVSVNENVITGYCLGRPGYHFIQIGPVIAKERKTAMALVSCALNNSAGKQVVMDVPGFDEGWKEWLISCGFKVQRPFIRMYRGTNKYPGRPENQFAILGPEFG